MRRVAKSINIKEDTLNDIRENNLDTEAFINRIKEHLEKANYLINNKMLDMNKEELYRSLSEVFDICFGPYDYIKLLSMKYNKHYHKFININTNMYDENGYNVSYLAIATQKANCNDGDTLDLNRIRKLTDSYDLILLRPRFEKKNMNGVKKEKYESHIFDYINVNNCIITENDELYPYATELLQKDTIIKYVLYDLKLYVDEVLHQAREITGLALIKDDDVIARIGKLYKKAYDKATSTSIIPKKEKISVRYHQKTRRKKR